MDINLFFSFIDNYKERINDLISTMSVFKQKINNIYLELAKILQDDIDDSLKKSHQGFDNILGVVDNTKCNNEHENKLDIGIIQLLELNQKNLTEITSPIRVKSDKSSESFSKSLKYLTEINQMLTSVDVVQDFSTEMEVLSYNSIIIASKSGVKGEGFRSISAYINELSKETNTKFQDLKNISQKVLDKYDNYNYIIINTRNLRIEKGHSIYQKSNDFFKKSKRLTNTIIVVLEDIINQILKTKKSMFDLILELQNEDIVNQIISNLLIQLDFLFNFLENLKDRKAGHINLEDENEIRDLYLFFNEVDGFLLDKIKRIKVTLDKLLNILINSLSNFSSTTKNCKESLNNVSDKLEHDPDSDISESFLYHSADLSKEYQYLITQLIGFQGEINAIGKEFLTNLNDVDKVYTKLEEIIENMQSVNVLVKIELAREKIEIDKSNNTGVVLEKMLNKIGDYLTKLINNFRNTKEKLNNLMTEISESVVQQKNKFISTNKLLKNFLDEFYEKAYFCEKEIKESIKYLKKVMNDVDYVTNKVKIEIDKIRTLIDEQNKEIKDLEYNKDNINNILMEKFDIQEPNIDMIKDKEINELLNEIEKRQDKSSLNKYLNEDFNFEENDNFIVF